MKKILIILVASLALFSSCKKDEVQKSQIVGILKLESDDVLAFTTVILKLDGVTVSQKLTDDNGIFVFDELDSGTYELYGYSDIYKLSKPYEIIIEKEKSVTIEFIFEPKVSVVGLVNTSPVGGAALEQMRIEIYDAETLEYIGFTRSNREGSFYLYDLKPGKYNLQVFEMYYLNWFAETAFTLNEDQPIEIYVQLSRRTNF